MSAAAVGLMGAAGIAGAPIIITAGVLTATPLVINWAYDKFVAPKLDETEDSLSNELKNNITNEIIPDTGT